ncbi:MAG: Imm40 family immunity protein [Candidatus Kapaibacterium sp.]
MDKIFSGKIDEILGIGIPLFDFGIHNWALTKEQALNALIQLKKYNIPVLGGDVYYFEENHPKSTYVNWFCDPKIHQTKKEFTLKSIDKLSCSQFNLTFFLY